MRRGRTSRHLTAVVVVFSFGLVAEARAQITPGSQPAAGVPLPALTLERAEQVALENNPTLRQAQAQIEAARARARQAGTWPNPVIGYSAEEIPLANEVRGGQHGVFVEQTVLLGGKLGLGRSVFRAEATEAEAFATLQRQRVLNAVRGAFYQALAAERRVDVQERLSRLIDEAVIVSRQLANVGAADKPDVLESEVEAFRARVALEQAKNRRFAVWRELTAVMGDPVLPLQPLAGNIESLIPEIDRDEVLKQVLSRSPELSAARASIERSRAIVSQSRRLTFPDLFLRGGFSNNREPTDGVPPRTVGSEVSFEAGVSVPIFDRNRGGIAAARADQTRAEAELRRIELALQSRFAGSYERYFTALRTSETYRVEILPRAEEAYKLYLARYREMGAAYPQVLIAQRSLLQLSDEYLAALEDAWRAAIDVEGLLATEGLGSPGRPGETTQTSPGEAGPSRVSNHRDEE